MKFRWLIAFLLVASASPAAFGQLSGTNSLVRFRIDTTTTPVEIDVIMLTEVAPKNVANFLRYVKRGDYDNSFIHRSPPNFVVQGGGFKYNTVTNQVVSIPTDPAVVNEFHVSNRRGTLAMAKVAGNPDSATSQWFFNEADSNAGPPANLDTENGGYTVFGRIINSDGLVNLDRIAAVPICIYSSPYDALPLRNHPVCSDVIQDQHLVHVYWVKVVPQIVALSRTNATTVHVTGRGTANTTYKLESSATGAAGTFATSVNVTTGSQGNFNYDDTNAGARKFYRVSIP